MLPPCLAVCFFTVSHGGSISAFKQVPKPTLISALKKKLRREYNLRSVNLRCSKACKPNSNSNALSILSLDDVALDYDGAIKTYTGSGTDLVIGMEGAAGTVESMYWSYPVSWLLTFLIHLIYLERDRRRLMAENTAAR